MDSLAEIPINQIVVYDNFRDTPPGSLLQIAEYKADQSSKSTIGIRCSHHSASGNINGLVFLNGSSLGQFVPEEDLRSTLFLDVSEFSSVVLREVSLDIASAPAIGDLCQVTCGDDKRTFAIAIGRPIIGYLPINRGAKPEIVTAKVARKLGRVGVIAIEPEITTHGRKSPIRVAPLNI